MQWSGARTGPSGQEFVFRPRTGLIVCVLWVPVTIIWVVMETRDGLNNLLIRVPAIVAVALAVWAIFGRPRVIIDSRGVTTWNVFRTVAVPFTRLREVSTRYSLTLTDSDERSYRAWAAPASGRFFAAREDPRSSEQISRWPRGDAETVARTVRRVWLTEGASLRNSEGNQEVEVRWATEIIVPFAVAVVLSVLFALVF